ncbi:hypothetical protein ACP4OV_018318 [Aristida adscensionis]
MGLQREQEDRRRQLAARNGPAATVNKREDSAFKQVGDSQNGETSICSTPYLPEIEMLTLSCRNWDHKCKKKKSDPKFPDKRSIVPYIGSTCRFQTLRLTQLNIRSLYIIGDTTVAYMRRMVEVAVNLKEIHLCERAPCKRPLEQVCFG